MTKEQILLARRVQAQIIREPETFDMANFIRRRVCGTTACIAGWAVLLHDGDADTAMGGAAIRAGVAARARELLGLKSSSLFYTTSWPPELSRKLYVYPNMTREAAEVAAEAIDLVIAGDGDFPGR